MSFLSIQNNQARSYFFGSHIEFLLLQAKKAEWLQSLKPVDSLFELADAVHN